MIAFDTNVLIYASELADPEGRNAVALDLMDKVASQGAIIPLQVVGEYINACRRKRIIPLESACDRANFWMDVYITPAASPDDYIEAASLAVGFNLQYFDALILTVAHRAGATVLLSEDMHDGLDAGGIRVVNPFVAENAEAITSALGQAA